MAGAESLLTIACVLKTGGVYNREYVARLVDGIRNNLDMPGRDYRIVCMTDDPFAVQGICHPVPLIRNWPGWWSKIELFRKPGRYLYFDLDTVIQGDITALAMGRHRFAMLRDFLKPELSASGVMAWDGDYTGLFFDYHMGLAGRLPRGDGQYISQSVNHEHLQDLYPGMFASYKKDRDEIKRKAAVVCFHGKPRPHDVDWQIERD